MMNIPHYEVDRNPTEAARIANREFLALHVKDVKCVSAGSFEHSTIPSEIKETLQSRLLEGEYFGTVEEYSNGYWNVFVKIGSIVVGIYKVKDE